ncbi:MAG TPA: DNA recombination protein RmuC, partial [Thermoanaerobaculia bacterium]
EAVGKSISGLEQLFASPKLRGGIGEWALDMLLGEVLPSDAVLRQHRLPSRGVVVDFAVKAADDRIIPIDSKFPLEAFRRLAQAEADGTEDAKRLRSEFIRSVKGRVDEIAVKYISPDDGTLEYALMYLPSEAIYYELAVRDDDLGFADYARNRKVMLCSPSTLYAYLQAITMGLRGLQMTEQVRWFQATLSHLQQDVARAREAFEKTQKQLMYASNNLGEVGGSLGKIEDRLTHIDEAPATLPGAPEQRQIQLETGTLFG